MIVFSTWQDHVILLPTNLDQSRQFRRMGLLVSFVTLVIITGTGIDVFVTPTLLQTVALVFQGFDLVVHRLTFNVKIIGLRGIP